MTESPLQAVSIRGLHKSYEEGGHARHVLRDVKADLEAGRIHAVLGRSGSGKSTLLNLIAGIDLPDEGTIEVAGHRINQVDARQRTLLRRRHIGIIFQFFNLIPSLTVEENVILPLELNKKPDRVQRANQALEQVGLAQRRSSYPDVLSGGEQQRVAIARAFVHRPQLILADEPTGNLDEDAARRVVDTLVELRDSCTVVIATHSLELASRADRQWQLRSGRLECAEES